MSRVPVPDPWPAPVSPGPLDATVAIPGSKSLTNRHLLVAALARDPVEVVAPLDSRDSRLMQRALTGLGSGITESTRDGSPVWTVSPLPLGPEAGSDPVSIDTGLAGTVMRFVPVLAALQRRPVTFDGDAAARRRPVGPVLQALRALGAHVDGGEEGFLPFTVTGNEAVVGGEVSIDASGSSQFVSALLLAAPLLPHGLTLRHTGSSLPSPQHIGMSLDVLRAAGITASAAPDHRSWRVEPGVPSPGRVVVEPDLSNAGPFLGAALICGGSVRIPHWPATTTQIGALWEELLPRMGARVQRLPDGSLQVSGDGGIAGGEFADTGELAPTLAALCALADGPSRLTGIAHLRGHETDRLAALVAELARVGIQARELEDGLEITPGAATAHGAVWESYEDHRMATAGAMVGLRIPGVSVRDVATTSKTMPDFVHMWERMLATAGTPTGDVA
ncbi:3-phosphoshikimate 1-carboxyvinyltransferase [Galactobacter sp.]|uniref:3-phosphoshikimate 1-carboxyvinyltransferase n=1 Tax=Galactobacter sp. TaxID=2676125 RepID=UPI0025BCE3AD|nr:3-phosphoshikimate 1-carboxyvinyltransferase [Galactobacter sp.]